MNEFKSLRVMWLLNDTTFRHFEIFQLSNMGVKEIFLPKSFPFDEGNLSASVTHEFDKSLQLGASDIELLNEQDWYGEPEAAAWEVANKYFDVIFIGFFPRQMLSACLNFKGSIVIRAFGLGGDNTYSQLIRQIGGQSLQFAIARAGGRLWFGFGYEHLMQCEEDFVANRSVFMPVGLKTSNVSDQWQGNEKRIFFVCPRIGSSPYFRGIYNNFIENFKGIPYYIGGAQPIRINDPNILGFVTNQRYSEIMRQSRVMFYHSQEPNHIHYHPFEAIRAGIPLVFMAGGMLDTMGGIGLPGRCRTVAEARKKIKRILADDWVLIEKIRASQAVLLEPMKPENCEPAWRDGFVRIVAELARWRGEQAARPAVNMRKRVAVILPVGYRGGSLRGAIALAQAIHLGSRQRGEDAEVVFAHLDDPASYSDDVFSDLPVSINRRSFNWKILTAADARRAMRYAGFEGWEPASQYYQVPDDGIQQLLDCDLWLCISDRILHPVLPIKPMALMVYDYLQRYENLLVHGADMPFLSAARSAERVLVTTEFTRQDALQYAGVEPRKVSKVPMLAPEFPIQRGVLGHQGAPFFIWTTNAAPHKNHRHAAEALRIYYEELQGKWDCQVTGVNTKAMLESELPHLKAMAEVFAHSLVLQRHVKWVGELVDNQYRQLLSQARFLWHAGRIDNGTFSVIEAACLGVPSLSSDYPAMREIDAQFSLSLAWMDPDSPRNMAVQLKHMELEATGRQALLPDEAQLYAQRIDKHAGAYWQEVRACL